MQISVTHTVGALLPKLDQFSQRQLPFSVARALTWTARDARDAVRADMPNRFTLRRQWVVQGIRYIPATKATMAAFVYSKDEFMQRQETGGIKTGKAGGGNFSASNLPSQPGRRRYSLGRVAVPTSKVLRGKSDIIRKSDLPSGLGTKAFTIKGRGDSDLLVRRFAKGKRAGLQVLYVLKRATLIKPRLGLHEIGTRVVKQKFAEHLERSLAEALANPKK